MAKKLTKQEIENDPLINYYATVLAYYQQHKQLILGIGGAILLLVALSIGYYYYAKSQEQKAQELLGFAEQEMVQGNYQTALQGEEQTFTVGFEQIINNYPITDAANLATYYAAVCEFNLGNLDQSLTYLEEYDPPDGFLGVSPISFHALVLATLDRPVEAAEKYIEAAEWDVNDTTSPYNYYKAAQLFQESGNLQQAQQYADKVLNDYPNSDQAVDAKKLKGQLLVMK